jgi:hypothetical protein
VSYKTLGELINDKLKINEIMTEDQTADDIQAGGNHYKDLAIQPWHLMEDVLTREEFIGYLKGNLIKYAMRQGKKDSPDAEKYKHYVMKLSEVLLEQ